MFQNSINCHNYEKQIFYSRKISGFFSFFWALGSIKNRWELCKGNQNTLSLPESQLLYQDVLLVKARGKDFSLSCNHDKDGNYEMIPNSNIYPTRKLDKWPNTPKSTLYSKLQPPTSNVWKEIRSSVATLQCHAFALYRAGQAP